MANLLATYTAMESELNRLQEELDKLKNDDRLKADLEFKDKLVALMEEYGKAASDVIDLLDPKGQYSGKNAPATGTGRRKRKLKIYKNPNTGEVVETRGGNQKTLKSWKQEFGGDVVESWLVRVEG